MNEPKPIYCIRSRSGRIEKEGSWAEINAWFKEGRIDSDDDLRRLGYSVLEKDELWGKVRDFPEFPDTERQSRQALYKARNRAYISMIAGIVIASIGLTLICYSQVVPRYTESNKVDAAMADARSSKELEKVAYEKLNKGREDTEKARVDADKARLKYEASFKKEMDQLTAELESSKAKLNQALAQTRGELVDAKSKLGDVAGRVSAELDAANRKNVTLEKTLEVERKATIAKVTELSARQKPMQDKIDELQKQNDAFMALYVRKSEQLKAEQEKSIVQKIFGNPVNRNAE